MTHLSARDIVVHTLEQARTALAAGAETGRPVRLVSPSDAAASLGIRWFASLIRQAAEAVPRAEFEGVIDCGDQWAAAAAALRQGLTVRARGPEAVLAKLASIAAKTAGRLDGDPGAPALDLLGQSDAEATCREWLSQPRGRSETPFAALQTDAVSAIQGANPNTIPNDGTRDA